MNHQQTGRNAEWVAALLGTVCIGRVLAWPLHDRYMNLAWIVTGLTLWAIKLLGRKTGGNIWLALASWLTRRPQ